jgi:hypothetical protein
LKIKTRCPVRVPGFFIIYRELKLAGAAMECGLLRNAFEKDGKQVIAKAL